MAETFDAIVIGGGIMGCSTALALARRGMQVVLLEKDQIGAGSTGRSSAIIRQHYSNEVTALMARRSLEIFQNFDELIGGDCGFTETGFLVLTPSKDVEGLKANVAMHQELGIQTELIDRNEIEARWPILEVDDIVAAAYEPESGYADPYLTVTHYARAASKEGAKIIIGAEVTGLLFDGEVVKGVEADGETYAAPIVINCTGAWGASTAALAGVEVPINACRVQVGFFRRPAEVSAAHPVVADFTHGAYWRDETGGLTLAGLIDPSEEKALVDPDAYSESVGLDFIADVGERLVRRFPAMEESESTGGYASLYGITPDWHPILDEAPAGSGFFVCAGFSGHGFKLGPAVGLMTADMATGDESSGLDRSMFRLSRFAENQPMQGAYEYSIVG